MPFVCSVEQIMDGVLPIAKPRTIWVNCWLSEALRWFTAAATLDSWEHWRMPDWRAAGA